MATVAPSRSVTCYHCRRRFDVPPKAMSISCPWCSRRVTLDDLLIRDRCWTSKLQTCGRIVIHRRGLVNARVIEAMEGIEIHGSVEGSVLSGGPVVLGAQARIRGDLAAPSIHIASGATIEGGMFRIAAALPPARDVPRPIARPGDDRPDSPSTVVHIPARSTSAFNAGR